MKQHQLQQQVQRHRRQLQQMSIMYVMGKFHRGRESLHPVGIFLSNVVSMSTCKYHLVRCSVNVGESAITTYYYYLLLLFILLLYIFIFILIKNKKKIKKKK